MTKLSRRARTFYLGEPELDDPSTDYAAGMLRGWLRNFGPHGYGVSFAAEGFTQGPMPTPEEWNVFDQRAQWLGVDQLVSGARDKALATAALRKNTGFVNQIGNALTAITSGLAKGDILGAFKGAQVTVETVSGQISRFVPGAGPVIMDLLTGALMPLLPFAPLLTESLATIGGNLPVVGPVLGPLVQAGGSGAQRYVEGIRPAGTTGVATTFNVATQQGLNSSLLQSLSDLAVQGAQDLGPLKASLLQVQKTYNSTNGPLLTKLETTTLEALNELSFAISVASLGGTLGAFSGLGAVVNGIDILADSAATFVNVASTTLTALKAGVTLALVYQASQQLKANAQKIQQAARAQAATLDAETAALERELAQLQALRAASKARATSSKNKGVALVAGALILAAVLS